MILVAGGSGRLGREVVRLLGDRAEPVRVLSRDVEAAGERLGPGVEVVAGDVTEAATLAPALAGVDAVVSAVTGFGPGAGGTEAVDERGNLNLIEAALAAGVRRFVLVSVEGAAPDHPMELMRRKHAAEVGLRASGLTWAIVRPTPFADLWSGIIGDPIREGSATAVFGRGDNPINFVAVSDVARVVEHALFDRGFEGTTAIVGGPDNVTLLQLVAMVEAATGRRAKVRRVPAAILRLGSRVVRPFKPDIAGMMEAALCMAGRDMTCDTGPLLQLVPGLHLTPLREVVRARFGAPVPGD